MEFVAAVADMPSLLELVRARCPLAETVKEPEAIELVSSPRFGVLDSGCGRTIVGSSTLREFEMLWTQGGISSPERIPETHQVRFGNGDRQTLRLHARSDRWTQRRHSSVDCTGLCPAVDFQVWSQGVAGSDQLPR